MVFVETSFPRGGTIKPAKKEAEQDASNTIVSNQMYYYSNEILIKY